MQACEACPNRLGTDGPSYTLHCVFPSEVLCGECESAAAASHAAPLLPAAQEGPNGYTRYLLLSVVNCIGQCRAILTEGKMFCHEEHALRLAALALQADRGDRTAGPASRTPHFRLEDYVPARVSGWLHATLIAPSATWKPPSLLLRCWKNWVDRI